MSNDVLHEVSRSTTNLGSVNEPKDEIEEEEKKEPVTASYAPASPSSSASSVTLPAPVTAKERISSIWRRVFSVDHLTQDIQPSQATFPLWCFCFISGFVNSVPFSSILLWCGFQTGNTVQLSIAIGRFLFTSDPDLTFQVADQQALVSLLCYLIGGYIGRFGDHVGSKKRIWLISGTILQALLTTAAALTAWKSGQPSVTLSRGDDPWTSALSFTSLAFASASMGLQGVMAKRIPSHFGATVVLTTLWSELIGDPDLWKFRYVKSRDHRLLAVLAFVLGAVLCRGLLNQTKGGSIFGIAAGFRVLIALIWLFVPAR